MDYNKLFVFYKAAQCKRFGDTQIGLSASTVSRHISDLEEELAFKLFLRTPRGLTLTPKGSILFQRAEDAFKKLKSTQELLSSTAQEREEELDVMIPTAWATGLLVRFLNEFMEKYPGIHLNIMSDDQSPKIDSVSTSLNRVAVLPYPPKDTSMIKRYLMTFRLGLFASRDYLEKHGVPQTVGDLDHHRLIASSGRDGNFSDLDWHLKAGLNAGESRVPFVRLNNMAYAAGAGLGISSLAEVNDDIARYDLVRILPDLPSPDPVAYYVYPEYLRYCRSVQLFGKFLIGVTEKIGSRPKSIS